MFITHCAAYARIQRRSFALAISASGQFIPIAYRFISIVREDVVLPTHRMRPKDGLEFVFHSAIGDRMQWMCRIRWVGHWSRRGEDGGFAVVVAFDVVLIGVLIAVGLVT